MSDQYKLYGTEVSLYTGKARAYMRYKGIPFEEILSTFQAYQKVIVPRTGVRFIPIIISPDDIAVQDTTEIIDFLEERFPEAPVYPIAPKQKLVALLFEVFGDEWIFLPAMHYRWFYKKDNLYFILSEFGATALPHAPKFLQIAISLVPALVFGGAVKRFIGVNKTNYRAVEKRYEEFLDQFNEHLKHHPFLLGARPSIGDFGLMAPLYAHLYRDPYPGRLMKSRAPEVAKWVERMNAPEPNSGEFLPGDEIPETLSPILETMFAEQFPVLLDTIKKVGERIVKHPDKPIPRFVGRHEFTVAGVRTTRAVWSFSMWMFQRPVNFYQSLSPQQKAPIDDFLKPLGGYEGMQVDIKRPIKRVNNKLMPA